MPHGAHTQQVIECISADGRLVHSMPRDDFIVKYEMGLSKSITEAGFAIHAINTWQAGTDWSSKGADRCQDLWNGRKYHAGTTIHPLDSIFFKSTRFQSPELKSLMAL